MKQGFTLVELLVVIGLFGILMLAGTTFLISVMRNANQARIENDLRQTAGKIMLDISAEMRKSTTASFSVTQNQLKIDDGTVVFTVNSDGEMTKEKNSAVITLTTDITKVSEFRVEPAVVDLGTPATVSLTVVAATGYRTFGFAPSVSLSDTIVSRVY